MALTLALLSIAALALSIRLWRQCRVIWDIVRLRPVRQPRTLPDLDARREALWAALDPAVRAYIMLDPTAVIERWDGTLEYFQPDNLTSDEFPIPLFQSKRGQARSYEAAPIPAQACRAFFGLAHHAASGLSPHQCGLLRHWIYAPEEGNWRAIHRTHRSPVAASAHARLEAHRVLASMLGLESHSTASSQKPALS